MRFACLTKINEWMLESKGFSSNVNNEINNWKEKKYLKKNFDNDALASHAIWWTHTHTIMLHQLKEKITYLHGMFLKVSL